MIHRYPNLCRAYSFSKLIRKVSWSPKILLPSQTQAEPPKAAKVYKLRTQPTEESQAVARFYKQRRSQTPVLRGLFKYLNPERKLFVRSTSEKLGFNLELQLRQDSCALSSAFLTSLNTSSVCLKCQWWAQFSISYVSNTAHNWWCKN